MEREKKRVEGEGKKQEEGWKEEEEEGAVTSSVTELPADQSRPRWAGLRACPTAARALKVCLFAEQQCVMKTC